METAGMDVNVAAAAVAPAGIILTPGAAFDSGLTIGDGRTPRPGWVIDGAIRRTDGLADIPPYVSGNTKFKHVCK